MISSNWLQKSDYYPSCMVSCASGSDSLTVLLKMVSQFIQSEEFNPSGSTTIVLLQDYLVAVYSSSCHA
jgi:hypothetical protein